MARPSCFSWTMSLQQALKCHPVATICGLLTIFDGWASAMGPHDLLFWMGDFNQEQELGALADKGAAQVVCFGNGTRLPTRWNGRRCVDWIWTSHPPMLSSVTFNDIVIADHNLNFQINFSHEKVRSFQQAPQLRRPHILKQDCGEALEKYIRAPLESDTTRERMTFCSHTEHITIRR